MKNTTNNNAIAAFIADDTGYLTLDRNGNYNASTAEDWKLYTDVCDEQGVRAIDGFAAVWTKEELFEDDLRHGVALATDSDIARMREKIFAA